jgi:putative PIN family toxin of toxin-antitoxin system
MTGIVVLDTNVWLDCLVFRDREATVLLEALDHGLQPIASPRMRDELRLVLQRPAFAGRGPDALAALADFDARVRPCDEAPATALRCSDPADQMFVDLACAQRAGWLLTRDRALLKLARRAARLHGVTILTPAAFASAYHGA